MAAALLLRGIPVLRRHRLIQQQCSGGNSSPAVGLLIWQNTRNLFNRSESQDTGESSSSSGSGSESGNESISTEFTSSSSPTTSTITKVNPAAKILSRWEDSPDYRQWKNKEDEILQDIEPIVNLTKEILHTDKYLDGERLSDEDEKAVIEKLLAYHPHSEDKVGVGLHSIMVDRHPQFKGSRCLFVIRTDGAWIDFSYQKCVRAYIRDKYPTYAERFIRTHYKRGSS
ncbi:hypothetical protein AQUCO_08300074v1 [Aquilegia coerulea]|uniref:Protein DCL, chloroplastic n=1 Tax=Aquilegia coerulea TaxID=218851 RepID=A0A2G5C767_AQUCA|nr:hypothetical protein AQUCO_08300074v1 [Aquilegia coerulea]